MSVSVSDRHDRWSARGRELTLRGRFHSALREIVHFATGGLKPDLTLLLDVDVETGLMRRQKDGGVNRLDALALAFHQRVRDGYHEMAATEPERWVIIDANQPPDLVQAAVREIVIARLV